jgi:signal transduction histidine kinase
MRQKDMVKQLEEFPDMNFSRPDRMVSLRWRLMLPIFALALIMVIVVVYAAVTQASSGGENAAALTQLTGLIFASLAALAVITTFIVLNWLIGRINRVTRVAEALSTGDLTARTGMRPTDEVSKMGFALDEYATRVQDRQDELRLTMRRQRREIAHLTSVLDALNDGIIVQDLDGQVTFINEVAKNLLDLPGGLRNAVADGNLEQLTTAITDTLGAVIAPGLIALGDAKRIDLNADQPDRARTLSVQAAAIISMNHHRVGTVLVLRDVTDEARREKAREAIISRIADEIQSPLESESKLMHSATSTAAMSDFAQDISRHAIALQKLVVEMRELTATSTRAVANVNKPISLDKMAWALVNEWRQTAQAANLSLELINEQAGLTVMGDERRLRWAIGNLLDNAIKYTPPGGKIALEIKGEEKGKARLRIRDSGVGIKPEELPHVFTRFYRGTPITTAGREIRIPGSGQGLTTAKEIIESHGGTITIKSQLGMGTAVYFTLQTVLDIPALATEQPLPPMDEPVGDDTMRI